MNVLHYDLKKDAINEFWIKYWTSNPVWVTFQKHGSSFYVNIEEKVWLLVKKIRTDRVTKTSLFDRNWAISLKPRQRSRLVWWALHCSKEIINKRHQMFMKMLAKRQADKKKEQGAIQRRQGVAPCYFAINETLMLHWRSEGKTPLRVTCEWPYVMNR